MTISFCINDLIVAPSLTDPSYPDRLTIEEQEARIKERAAQGVDWIETDAPEHALRLLV